MAQLRAFDIGEPRWQYEEEVMLIFGNFPVEPLLTFFTLLVLVDHCAICPMPIAN